MKGLDALRRQLEILQAAMPKPEPWPPEDSFAWCLYEKLGHPATEMRFFDMYEAVVSVVWAGEAEIIANDCEVSIC
jgi:hypothetical protein